MGDVEDGRLVVTNFVVVLAVQQVVVVVNFVRLKTSSLTFPLRDWVGPVMPR